MIKDLSKNNKSQSASLSWSQKIKKDFKKNKVKYFMISFIVLYYILFYYLPLYGSLIAFQDFSPRLGFLGSDWVGLKHFKDFISGNSFFRVLKNTFLLSGLDILIGFPLPIIFALLLNEIRSKAFKKTIQTVSYMPHFISLVIVCGMIKNFCGYDGLINDCIEIYGGERLSILQSIPAFKYVYVLSNVWQELGWNSIIYIAALGGINAELYEAAKIDGANRFKQTIHVTIPGIMGTIMIMLIMRIGQVLSVGYEKVLLLYNPTIYDSADVISTYIYRKGLVELNWSFSSAVGLFNSIVNFVFLIAANTISKKTTEVGLW